MSNTLNLERLRKEAKALLKQIRAGDVAAIERIRVHLPKLSSLDTSHFASQIKLADIQYALAREHGFESWAELKRRDSPLERFLAAVRGGSFPFRARRTERFSGSGSDQHSRRMQHR